ncbi:glycosyltransferase [Acidovorax citrulli]|nr:glycosyltransferase [Paracidovorax citrulli]
MFRPCDSHPDTPARSRAVRPPGRRRTALSAAPDFSLVVATIDPDGALLRALLDSLADSTERSFEVIVADQTQGDHLARVVDDFAGRLCVHRLSLPTRGASAARNAERRGPGAGGSGFRTTIAATSRARSPWPGVCCRWKACASPRAAR